MRQITVIHPSRGRAELARKAHDAWKKAANQPFVYFLAIEPDQQNDYGFHFWNMPAKVNDSHTAIESINMAAAQIDFDILVVMSDDFECRQGWDDLIREAVGDRSDFLLKTYDGEQKWIITLPIMDRVYYQRYGYVYYPGYQHLFCDTELAAVGDYTGKTIYRLDIVFNHNQKLRGEDGKDAVQAKNDSSWNQGKKLFLERYAKNFEVEKLFEISHAPSLNWIKENHCRV